MAATTSVVAMIVNGCEFLGKMCLNMLIFVGF